MTRDRWQQVERVLDAVLECEPREWDAIIAEHCGADAELRTEVASLLARFGPAQRFLDVPAVASIAAGAAGRAASVAPGRRIGPYLLVREIGHGGMAQVFLAERDDGEFQQRVAVKLLRPGAEGEEPDRRFRIERQILAGLEHPHVARMLDGGLTDDARPFLVMEYVDGTPIHRYCDGRGLGTEQRLALFICVCDAVQYAHRNLVVHRDLKPANILVAGDGQVKVLDFGIAKLLAPDRSDLTLPETRPGQYWLTPEYAAPEQLRGESVTTLTDVYQLGVVLYELLTGRRPFDTDGAGRHEVERAVIDSEPTRPSVVAAPRGGVGHDGGERSRSGNRAAAWRRERVDRRLRGDLDAIALKALRKEPEQRYASPGALADDVRRHLAGRPVEARGGAAAYRARRFVRRHRAGVAMAAVLVLVLAGYGVTATVQRERVIVALDHARLEAEKSEQVAAFLIGLFEAADPTEPWGLDLTGRELLGRAARRAESLDDQPEVQARLLEVIARTYQRLAAPSSARPLAERALEIRQELRGGDHADVAASLHDLGTILWLMGDSTAEAVLRRAIEMRRRLLGDEHEDLAASLFALGGLLGGRGDHDTAQAVLAEALAIQRETLGSDHPQTGQTLNRLGLDLWENGDAEAAEPFVREALEIRRETLGADHTFVAADLNNLGLISLDRGDDVEAESLFREALAINQRLIGDDHHFNVRGMNNLAIALREQGKYTEADSLLRRAIAILRPVTDTSSQYTRELAGLRSRRQLLAIVLVQLGRVYLNQREAAAAEPILREAVDIHQGVFQEGDWRIADAKGWLGECLVALGRHHEAEPILRSSHAGLLARWGSGHARTRAARARLAALPTN